MNKEEISRNQFKSIYMALKSARMANFTLFVPADIKKVLLARDICLTIVTIAIGKGYIVLNNKSQALVTSYICL